MDKKKDLRSHLRHQFWSEKRLYSQGENDDDEDTSRSGKEDLSIEQLLQKAKFATRSRRLSLGDDDDVVVEKGRMETVVVVQSPKPDVHAYNGLEKIMEVSHEDHTVVSESMGCWLPETTATNKNNISTVSTSSAASSPGGTTTPLFRDDCGLDESVVDLLGTSRISLNSSSAEQEDSPPRRNNDIDNTTTTPTSPFFGQDDDSGYTFSPVQYSRHHHQYEHPLDSSNNNKNNSANKSTKNDFRVEMSLRLEEEDNRDLDISTRSVQITPEKNPPPPTMQQLQEEQQPPMTPTVAALGDAFQDHDEDCGRVPLATMTSFSPFSTFRQNSTHIALDETQVYVAKILELEQALQWAQQEAAREREEARVQELERRLLLSNRNSGSNDRQQAEQQQQHEHERKDDEIKGLCQELTSARDENSSLQTQLVTALQAKKDAETQCTKLEERVVELQNEALQQKVQSEREKQRLVQTVQAAVTRIQQQYDHLDQQVAHAADSCGGRILELSQLVAHLQASIIFDNDVEVEEDDMRSNNNDGDAAHRGTRREEAELEWKVTSQGSLECQTVATSIDDVEVARDAGDANVSNSTVVCTPLSCKGITSPGSFLNATIHQNNHQSPDLALMEEARYDRVLLDHEHFASLFHDDDDGDHIADGVVSPRDFGSFELDEVSMAGLSHIFSPDNTPCKVVGTQGHSAAKENVSAALQLLNSQDKIGSDEAERDLLRQSYNEIAVEKDALQSQLTEQQTKLNDVNVQLAELKRERDTWAAAQDREPQLREGKDLFDSLNALRLEKEDLQAQVVDHQSKIFKVELRASEVETERNAINEIAVSLQKQVSSLERDRKNLLEKYSLAINELIDSKKTLSDDLDIMEGELVELRNKLGLAEATVVVIEAERDDLKSHVSKLEQQVVELKGSCEAIVQSGKRESDILRQSIKTLTEEKIDLASRLVGVEVDLQSQTRIAASLKKEAIEWELVRKGLENDLRISTEEYDALRQSTNAASKENDMNKIHLETAKARATEMEHENNSLKTQLLVWEQRTAALNQRHQDVVQDRVYLSAERDSLLESINIISAKNEALAAQLAQSALDDALGRCTEMDAIKASLVATAKDNDRLRDECHGLDEKLRESGGITNTLREDVVLLQSEKEQLLVDLDEKVTALDDTMKRADDLQSSLNASQSALDELKIAFFQCNEKLASSTMQISELFETLESFKLTQEAAEELAHDAEERLLATQNAMCNLRREHDELKILNETLTASLRKLEDESAALLALSEAQLTEKENDLQTLATAKNAIVGELSLCQEQLKVAKLENKENVQARQKSTLALSVVRQELARCQDELKTSRVDAEQALGAASRSALEVREERCRCQEALTKADLVADEASQDSARAILALRQELDQVTSALHKEQNEGKERLETIAKLEEKCNRLRDYLRKLTSKCDQWESFYKQHNAVVARLKRANDIARQRADELACGYAERDKFYTGQLEQELLDIEQVLVNVAQALS